MRHKASSRPHYVWQWQLACPSQHWRPRASERCRVQLGRYHGWHMDALWERTEFVWTLSWLAHGCSVGTDGVRLDVIMVGTWMLCGNERNLSGRYHGWHMDALWDAALQDALALICFERDSLLEHCARADPGKTGTVDFEVFQQALHELCSPKVPRLQGLEESQATAPPAETPRTPQLERLHQIVGHLETLARAMLEAFQRSDYTRKMHDDFHNDASVFFPKRAAPTQISYNQLLSAVKVEWNALQPAALSRLVRAMLLGEIHLEGLHAIFDLSQDGLVSVQELQQALKLLLPRLSEDQENFDKLLEKLYASHVAEIQDLRHQMDEYAIEEGEANGAAEDIDYSAIGASQSTAKHWKLGKKRAHSKKSARRSNSLQWEGPFLQKIVEHPATDLCMSVLILCNALVFAFEAQYRGLKLSEALGFSDEPMNDLWPGAVWLLEKLVTNLPVNSQILRLGRIFRLLRLLRLVRKIQEFDALFLMTTAIRSSVSVLLGADPIIWRFD
ncbi:hypothetical protein AK812_SmicGene450 [Symbiodinium microadriaticum]|uniref:EF-hand domain-containing protein n=1 Tax=Symbiodinium microadriaticum TaxID=2951 RepID=A0A1Q9F6T7_SYMMI|nr:hypothetical protein AK812_SmicGene450 [Symbiodinium microadriaticum]